MTFIFDFLLDALATFFKDIFMNILNCSITALNQITFDFWSNKIIQAFLSFSMWINWMVFICAFIFALADAAEEAGGLKEINWLTVMLNFFKGMLFTGMYSYLAIGIMQIANILSQVLNFDFVSNSSILGDILNGDKTSNGAMTVMMIVFSIGITCFIVMSLKRFGTMFVQIFTAAFYIPDIVRGETTKLGDWLRQTIAIAFTYTFQFILFYIGFITLLSQKSIIDIFIAISVWLAMFGVSHVLNKYGYSSGVKGSGIGMMASQGLQLMTRI